MKWLKDVRDAYREWKMWDYMWDDPKDSDDEIAGPSYDRPMKWWEIRFAWIRFVWDESVPHVWGRIVCRYKGHDWEDTSSAGPDSGDMSGTCKRCGESFHTQLY